MSEPNENNTHHAKDSSQNATKHGCRAARLILKDESEFEYQTLRNGWLEDYPPTTPTEHVLLDNVVNTYWTFRRNLGRHLGVETWLDDTPYLDWSLEQHKKLELFTRYRTTAERSFYRAFGILERHRKDRKREIKSGQTAKERADNMAAKQEEKLRKQQEAEAKQEAAKQQLETAKLEKAEKPAVKKPATNPNEEPWTRIEQWVEVRTRDNQTETRCVPTNEELEKEAAAMTPHPDAVFRRILFLGSVPNEYDWLCPNETIKQRGGAGIQRMTWDAWKDCIAREQGGHLTAARFGKLTRWQKP